jgi:hypothetical protein
MPAKKITHPWSNEQAQALAAARARFQAQTAKNTLQLDVQKQLAICKKKLKEAEDRCDSLEHHLQMEQEKSAALYQDLQAEKDHSANLYRQLRVERRACQRGNAHKDVLERQIQLLKLAEISSVQEMKESSSKAIDALIKTEKENSRLQSELSKALEQFTAEVSWSQQKLGQVRTQVKGYQTLVAKLQRRCSRAKATIQKVKKQTKQICVHRLLHKGIYTEETQNLI